LPGLHLDFQTRIDIHGISLHLADAAEALLELKVIGESDWNGDMLTSLRNGVDRHFSQALSKGKPLSRLKVDLEDPTELIMTLDGVLPDELKGRGYSSFMVWRDDYEEFFLENGVLELEAISKGSGYAVMRLLCAAVGNSISAVTPAWCLGIVDDYYEENDEYEVDRYEEGYLPSRKSLEKLLPIVKLEAEMDCKAAVTKALKRRISDRQRCVLTDALLLTDIKWLPNHDRAAMCYHNIPVAIRWEKGDRMDEISDSYHNDVANEGGPDVCFMPVFTHGVPRDDGFSAWAAAAALKQVIDVVSVCSRILSIIAFPAGSTLAEVFEAEQMATPGPSAAPLEMTVL
jgi:hypothetical protein